MKFLNYYKVLKQNCIMEEGDIINQPIHPPISLELHLMGNSTNITILLLLIWDFYSAQEEKKLS